MEGIIKKPQYKIMHVIFNQCMRLNFSKALFTVFLFTIIEMLLSTIPFYFAMGTSSAASSASAPAPAPAAGAHTLFGAVLSFVLTAAFIIFVFMMLYGMFCVTARMVQKKNVTVGWLFIAFRKKDKRVLVSSILFTVFYILLAFLTGILFNLVVDKTGAFEGAKNSSSYIMCFFMIMALVFIVSFIPFSFVHLILYYFKETKVFASFALSVRILWGQVLHYLGFVIYAAGTSLISVILLSLVLFFIPKNMGTSVGIVTMFLSILRLFEYYKVLSRVLLALPIYFFFTIGAIQVSQSDYLPPSESEK